MSAAKYHINQETQRPNICKAEPGKCPVGGSHFSSKEEAREFVEKTNTATYGATQTSMKKPGNKATSNTPHTDAYRKAKAKMNKLDQAIDKAQREIKKAKLDMLENGSKGLKRANLAVWENNLRTDQMDRHKLNDQMGDLKLAAEQEQAESNIDAFTTVDEGRARLNRVNKSIQMIEQLMSQIEEKMDSTISDDNLDKMAKSWRDARDNQRKYAQQRARIVKQIDTLARQRPQYDYYTGCGGSSGGC